MKKLTKYFVFLSLTAISIWLLISFLPDIIGNEAVPPSTETEVKEEEQNDEEYIKAITIDKDTSEHIIRVSDAKYLNIPYDVDKKAGVSIRRVFTGRRINIAVIGVDSRLGSRYKHADANHILSILVEQGKIEITSIPRDTPADAGFDDTTGQNKLTVMYASRGRKAYFEEVANIAGLDRIHYYAEIGFSQAMGILEWFGYNDPGSTLQILRSRTGLGGDDYQRVYNQAQFIKQVILKHFDKFSGLFGKLILRGGLLFIETNLRAENAELIYEQLRLANFLKSPDDIEIRIRPPVPIDYKIYDFSDKQVLMALESKIRGYNSKKNENTSLSEYDQIIIDKLDKVLNNAILDSLNKPNSVINTLKVYFDQRAWMQIQDKDLRRYYRDEIGNLLIDAYEKRKQSALANRVREVIEAEKILFGEKNNNF